MVLRDLRLCDIHFSFNLEYFKQSWQFSTNCSNCSFMPGQYTVSLALILHLLRPRCPSCISLRISSLFLSGIIILVPFNINPSSIVSSSWKVQYFLYLDWNFFNCFQPSLLNDVFLDHRLVISLCGYSYVMQTVTSSFKLAGNLINLQLR